MLLQEVPLGDDCHCMVPVFPFKVNNVLFVPEQTVVAPVILPATEVGLTVNKTLCDVIVGQVNPEGPVITTS